MLLFITIKTFFSLHNLCKTKFQFSHWLDSPIFSQYFCLFFVVLSYLNYKNKMKDKTN